MTSSAIAYSSLSSSTVFSDSTNVSNLSANRIADAPNKLHMCFNHAPWNPAPITGRRLAQISLFAGINPSPIIGSMISVSIPFEKLSAWSLNIVRTATGSLTTTNHFGPAPKLYTPPYSR